MKVRPSVVFGLGSSGAYVISNIERLLYEVIGEAKLDFLRLIAIDTDNTRKEDEPPPGGYRRQNLPIYESNLGRVMATLRNTLQEHFDWCGTTPIHIPGAGAGNLRGGGRLMLFNRIPEIWQTIQTETHTVRTAALQVQTESRMRDELNRRGIGAPPGLIQAGPPVVYTIGTLAGGTGSGSCVDFGYLIRDAAPDSVRVGIFFIPDHSAPMVFQENTWAALKDLEYFCQNPDAFSRTVWPEANQDQHHYRGGTGWPYDWVYLISQADEQRVLRLRYESNARSPLMTMAALQVTADILGLFEHRDGVLSNINAQVPGEAKHHMFLNFNVRAVCYPKYEISEAATCVVIGDSVCKTWLSADSHYTQTGAAPIRVEDWRTLGRKFWNDRFDPVWRGAQSSVDLAGWTKKLIAGDVPDPEAILRHQFAGNVTGTIYSLVAHQLPNRLRELETIAADGLSNLLQQTRNIRCAELFMEGFRQEIAYTLEYWTQLGIPPKSDEPAWLAHVGREIENCLHNKSRLSVVLLNASSEVLRDELQAILDRLEMFLLRRTLWDFNEWLDRHMVAWLAQLRHSVEAVRNLAANRQATVRHLLNGESAPVLRLSRSAKVNFDEEIQELASKYPTTRIHFLKVDDTGHFEGLFAVKIGQDADADQELFLSMKSMLQPEYLRNLESKGPVDIVQEIKAQNRTAQAVSAMKETFSMSLATKLPLVRSHTAVPSFVCARDSATAQRLCDVLRAENPGLPQMQPKALPVFDHMAIFYQEGAKLDPDVLTDSDSFARNYERAMSDQNRRVELLNPLATIKKRGAAETA